MGIEYIELTRQTEQLQKITALLESIDRRLSHIEDWAGQIESEIKAINRGIRK